MPKKTLPWMCYHWEFGAVQLQWNHTSISQSDFDKSRREAVQVRMKVSQGAGLSASSALAIPPMLPTGDTAYIDEVLSELQKKHFLCSAGQDFQSKSLLCCWFHLDQGVLEEEWKVSGRQASLWQFKGEFFLSPKRYSSTSRTV